MAALLASVQPACAAEDERALIEALVRARLAEEAGKPGAALAALTMVASQAPDLPGLDGRMLDQAIEAGDLAAARSMAMRLWGDGNHRFDARLVLTVDALRRSDWRAARDYIGESADKTGGDAISRLIGPTIHGWIDVGARAKNPERHLLLAAARTTRPEPARVLEAALIQLAADRPADAVALTDGVTLTDRTSQLVALRLATTFDAAGRTAAAERLRGRIALAAGAREDPLALLPDQPVTSPRGGVAHWLGLLADGFARTPNANPKIPLLFARAAHWLNDGDWTVRSALVESLDRNGQAADALALLAAIEAPPPVLQMRRAELMADAGDLPGAVALAEAAVAGEAPARSLLIRFADIARRSGDPAAAARAYVRLASALGKGDADTALRATLLIARAEILLQAGDWDAAQPLIEKAVALQPQDATILNFAGYSALERRIDVAQSLARIEAAWTKQPEDPSITDSLGWAYFLTGRTEDAVRLLEKAQRGAPDNPIIVEHLGDAYWQAGRKFQARYVWRAAALLAEADMATRIETKLRNGLTTATTAP